MTFRPISICAASVLSTLLLAVPALAQTRPAEPASPYGGEVVERIIARINDQIITQSDYDRALKEVDDEMRQHGATMQQISEAHRDLLRNMIDQQLWLSKGKELGISGEDGLVRRLDEIRKQYNLASLEDLEKAAQEQGVSFEDFKQNIRNQIITQEVMRQEVGAHISFTPGEVQRYYQEHQTQYQQPESVKLSEILIPTAEDASAAQVSEAEAKANDVEAKLKGGADFAQLARTQSAGQTAAQGGDLGTYRRGQLGAQVFEDATFSLPTGGVSQPIRTRQGFVIFKVVQHTPAGVQPYKQVEQQVEQDYYESKMEPAIRDELNRMRDDAYIEIDQKDGYVDTGATGNKRINPIAYAAYTPPTSKKKRKVERTRFRETAHFRSKTSMPTLDKVSAEKKKPQKQRQEEVAIQKPGKKEKIRFGQSPTKTLPSEPQGVTEDAGAGTQVATAVQSNDLTQEVDENAPPERKTRFSDRARLERKEKEAQKRQHKAKTDALTPAPPSAAEVADQQTQSSSLGLNGDTSKKKKDATTTGQKTRYSDRAKEPEQNGEPQQPTPIPAVQGAPAPPPAPPPAPANPQPQP
ncbi:MAG TPA: peptidylprolyl isomerase [Terracidiphilus sp.]|nr:peptidylprolyl isomerase [Terracidiphilus sp.]